MEKGKLYHSLKISGHVLFWLASIGLMLFFFYFNEQRVHFDLQVIIKAMIANLGFAMGVYINLYVLIPRYLKKKQYVFYVFWLVILLSASSITIQLLFIYPLRNVLEFNDDLKSFNPNLHSAYFFATLIYVALTSFLKFIKEWLEMQDLNLKLARIEQQKLEAELKTLKGQLNPHFLFNSLNNIYSLALIQSEKVPGLILRLSDLMRHIIYDSSEKYISLNKEIEFVNNFIALQKIRTPDHVHINYEINGEIPSAKIAPLLFEPFIDNAFKHGLPGNEKQDYIAIHFDFKKQGEIRFHIENNFDKSEKTAKKHSGIGVGNVKQRLRHLYSPKDYSLDISIQNNVYSVNLQLKLI
ncbi:MAG: sensor histidine kinase [Tangfeifania sp.]